MSKVVSLSAFKKKKDKEVTVEEKSPLSFDQIMEENAKKEERLKKERENANKGVIKSYRLKKP